MTFSLNVLETEKEILHLAAVVVFKLGTNDKEYLSFRMDYYFLLIIEFRMMDVLKMSLNDYDMIMIIVID